jgi:hypothetical protein
VVTTTDEEVLEAGAGRRRESASSAGEPYGVTQAFPQSPERQRGRGRVSGRPIVSHRGRASRAERHENILVYGPTGVEKSHISQALAHEACRRRHEVLFQR